MMNGFTTPMLRGPLSLCVAFLICLIGKPSRRSKTCFARSCRRLCETKASFCSTYCLPTSIEKTCRLFLTRPKCWPLPRIVPITPYSWTRRTPLRSPYLPESEKLNSSRPATNSILLIRGNRAKHKHMFLTAQSCQNPTSKLLLMGTSGMTFFSKRRGRGGKKKFPT